MAQADPEVREWCRLAMYGHITEQELFEMLKRRLDPEAFCGGCGRERVHGPCQGHCDNDE